MTYSLHHPPAGLTGLPRLFWPLVYAQLIALKAWVRQHYGPGMPYWYTVSRWGRVSLCHMPMDFTHSYAAPGALKPTAFDFTLARQSLRLSMTLAAEPRERAPAPAKEQDMQSVHGLSVRAVWDSS